MITRIYFSFFLTLLFTLNDVCSFAQKDDFDSFKTFVYEVDKDTLVSIFESKINTLKTKKASEEIIVEYLLFQIKVSDSLKVNDLKNLAAMELITYPKIIKKSDLFDFQLRAGNYQNKVGNYDIGTEIHFKALKLAEELNNDTLKAKIFFRMGRNFTKAGNFNLAEKYFRSAIATNIKLDDSNKLSGSYMSFGNSFKNSGIYDSALFYYDKSLQLAKVIDNERTISGNFNNIGNVYRLKNKYRKAVDYYEMAVDMNIKLNNRTWLSYNYNNLGLTYKLLKNYNKALKYYQESLKIKDELKDYASKISTKENISELYFLKRNYKKAYENLSEAENLRNEYENTSKLNLTASLEAKFQNEKKESLLKQLKAEQELQEVTLSSQKHKFELQSEVKKERQKLMVILAVIIASLLLGVLLFWRNSLQRKKYVNTLHQKNNQIRSVNSDLQRAQKVLTKKNNEITDSITYAKRIQAAILPSQNLLNTTLENAFVLYLPKDIVAGDFYWTERTEDSVLFAVADCTGHGVPGAIVSVICNSALNTSVKNDHLSDPGEILDNTTEIVLNQFAKSEEDVKDGMDIALCAFDKKTKILKYSGANIPLWLIRNGEVIEYKATRQPVGKYVIRNPFTTNEIKIENNDIIYLSSDGYADQFGGLRNKKYMKKNFKKLLLEVSENSISKQNDMINTVFIDWKAANEQVDDICVMGMKFNY